MKTYIKNFFFVILLIVISASSVSAATLKSGELVVLPKDTVVADDYFAAGETVTVSGTIAGDAYIAGGKVDIEGTVQGDLLVAGGTVTIRGTVEKDVRAAGGEVIVSGIVNGNITVIGGSVTISDGAQLSGNVVGGAGDLKIYAPIAKDIVVGAGELMIANSVAGDVVAGVGELTLSPNAQVAGNLTYYSDEQIAMAEGAVVSGKVSHPQIEKVEKKETAKNVTGGAVTTARVLNIISAFILGMLALRFFPNATAMVESHIQKNPWASMGIGLLALIVTPILMIIFFVTVIGIPIAMVLLFAYFFYIYISKIFVALVLGRTFLGYFKAKYPQAAVLAIGLIMYLVITSIPVIGGIVVFVSVIMGVGALILGKKDYYKMLVTKKVV